MRLCTFFCLVLFACASVGCSSPNLADMEDSGASDGSLSFDPGSGQSFDTGPRDLGVAPDGTEDIGSGDATDSADGDDAAGATDSGGSRDSESTGATCASPQGGFAMSSQNLCIVLDNRSLAGGHEMASPIYRMVLRRDTRPLSLTTP